MTLESDSDAGGGPGAGSQYRTLYRYTKALSVALGYRDPYTRLHSERVLALSHQIGVRAGLSERDLTLLSIGASFHDVGKIGIPDHILLKPTRLDAVESDEMKRHAELGERIILSTEIHGADAVARVIRHHHENFDGTGYPDSLSGESIPVCSRIIGVADSYDAMALTRSYHHARSHREIVEIMREESGRKHDRELLRIFLEIIEESDYRAVEI